MQCFGATFKVDPHFLLLNGIIQTKLVAFSLKTSRACTDISFKNDPIKFSKTVKNTNSMCIMCTIVTGLVELVFFSKQICC